MKDNRAGSARDCFLPNASHHELLELIGLVSRILTIDRLHAQAFNVPYNLMSASDPNVKARDVMEANLAGRATHWFSSLTSQARRCPCTVHPFACSCEPAPAVPDLGVSGTPCHPFSQLREGRFSRDSVEQHREFDVGVGQFMEWLSRLQPKCHVFEQVDGFMQPFDSTSSESPYQRRDFSQCILTTTYS